MDEKSNQETILHQFQMGIFFQASILSMELGHWNEHGAGGFLFLFFKNTIVLKNIFYNYFQVYDTF